jgi:predicted TIM-barrel fold metal-dependent hydrolase
MVVVLIRYVVGPALEAFGFSRIMFGSSPSPSSNAQSNAGDWYEIARESLLELGVDQEAVDSVFGINARRVYGEAS